MTMTPDARPCPPRRPPRRPPRLPPRRPPRSHHRSPRWGLWLVLVAFLALSGACSDDASRPAGRPPVPVTTATAVQREVPVQVKAIGQVEALATVSITAQVSGQLQEVHFKEGEEVEAGQLLFTIDPRVYQAALDQALGNLAKDRALLKEYQQALERNKKMVARDFVSRQDYDKVVAAAAAQVAVVKADQAAVEKARLDLEFCHIRAPIAGRTGSLLVHQGNVVNAGTDQPLVVIKRIRPCYVSFAVPERELERIQHFQGSKGPLLVQATPPDSQGPPEQGRLSFIDNQVDKDTGTILLKGTFPNAKSRLWPGQFVRVSLTLTTIPQAVVVPRRAVQTGPKGMFVFVVKADSTVEMRPVKKGEALDGEVVVSQGLRAGEKVVTDGQLALYPGAKVVEARPASSQTGGDKGGDKGDAKGTAKGDESSRKGAGKPSPARQEEAR